MLRIENLSAGYGARDVLRGISLDVEAGEIVALCGPNGCGKSTLLRCIAGLMKPRAGRVLIAGDDLAPMTPVERARRIAMLRQFPAEENDDTTAFHFVALGRTPYLPPFGNLSKSDEEIVEKSLRAVQGEAFRDRAISQLSGGERQRVSLARALAQQPQILLLDEPASNLDIRYAHEMLQLVLTTSRREKLAVVVVLHQLNLAAAVCDTMLLLGSEGTTRAQGTPRDVMTADHLQTVFATPLSVSPHPLSGRPQARSDWQFHDEKI